MDNFSNLLIDLTLFLYYWHTLMMLKIKKEAVMKNLIGIIIICIVAGLCIFLFKTNDIDTKTPEPILPTATQDQSFKTDMDFDKDNCECESECICSEGETDCDCHRTKSTCICTQEDGKTVKMESIETNNDDIEEENPEETSDEGESILSE